MALTRPRFTQINTAISALSDPIVSLNTNNANANVDIGFIFNRAHDTVSNVALFWSEQNKAITTAFTANSGTVFFANVVTDGFVDLETGAVTVHGDILPAANVSYDLGSPTRRFRSLFLDGNTIDLGGATIKSSAGSIELATPTGARFSVESQVGGGSKGSFDIMSVSSALSSTNTQTGALTVAGGLGVAGNLYVADLYLGTVSWAGNGTSFAPYTEQNFLNSIDQYSGNLNVNVVTATEITADNALVDRGNDQLNWDTLTVMGVYLVNRDSWSGVVGAPVDSQIFVGVLEILNTSDLIVVQNYRPHDTTSGVNSISYVYYTRSKYSSASWSPWREIVNGEGRVDGGSF